MNRKPQEKTEKTEEEADYINEPVCTVEKVAAPPDQRFCFFTSPFPLISVCWLILLVIMGLRIHFSSVISENNTMLMAEIQNLTTEKQELEEINQELLRQKNNLTEHIQDMETNWNELNNSRAQWSIDAYCPKTKIRRQCEPCQDGWIHFDLSCYAINNPAPPHRKTWEEARENCRGHNADFVVIHDRNEMNIISYYSWGSSGTSGYWIGLRVEDGKWKWTDGSNLTDSSWIEAPADGRCAVSFKSKGWKSVRCDVRQQWICKKNALSL